ncbi:MAG TPA: FAD-dependent oxidoreductase [Anaeromyxobacteraceae bacterium]
MRHAREEGIEFCFLHSPVEIHVDDEGDVRGMRAQKMVLGEPDANGRRKPMPLDEFVEFDCDTVIYALGTKANPIVAKATQGLALNRWGYIVADEATQATNLPGVFAGGDIVTGGATVILAMGAGRRAAKGIATWLQKDRHKWPITKEDTDSFTPPTPMTSRGSKAAVTAALARGEDGEEKVCPKCGRPLEGEEEYLCCGTAQLSWRCGACGKVSEGFAFPYGMCPSCGGKLEVLDPRRFDEAQALEAIRIAFEIELGGQAFYNRAAAESKDPALKELFSKFARMEEEHMATLSRRYHAEVPKPSKDFQIERAAVYAGIPSRPEDPANLFRIAIAFEQRAVKFFAERGVAAAAGSAEMELYKELAAEEREHVDLLTTEYERWKQGKPGLL